MTAYKAAPQTVEDGSGKAPAESRTPFPGLEGRRTLNRCATGAGRACVPVDGVFSIGPVGLPPFYAAKLETLAGKTIPRLHSVFMSGYVRLPAGTALCDASLGDLTGCPVLIPVRSTAVSGYSHDRDSNTGPAHYE